MLIWCKLMFFLFLPLFAVIKILDSAFNWCVVNSAASRWSYKLFLNLCKGRLGVAWPTWPSCLQDTRSHLHTLHKICARVVKLPFCQWHFHTQWHMWPWMFFFHVFIYWFVLIVPFNRYLIIFEEGTFGKMLSSVSCCILCNILPYAVLGGM